MLVKAEATVADLRALARRSKFGNSIVHADGHTFDSEAEYARYQELKLLQQAGEIVNLEVHPRYEVCPTIRRPDGKVWFRKTNYELDFSYTETATGRVVCEDVKGYETPEWKMKARMFLLRYMNEVDFRVIPASQYRRS